MERPAAQHGGLRLTLAVTGDGMGAKLRIEGHDNRAWSEAYGTASRLKDFLLEQGLAEEGLRADMVGWIAETLCRTTPDSRERDLREAQSVEVARGRAPLHEEPVGLAFHKSYITDAAVIADLRRAAGDSGTWDAEGLRDRVDPACWVAIGAVIVSWQGTARGMNGMDVFGAPIPAQGLAERLPSFGKSLQAVETRLIAVCEGALLVEDGVLKVLGGDSLPACQVVVDEDAMSANLVLGGNSLSDWSVTYGMVQAALREKGVVGTLSEADIHAALKAFDTDRRPVSLLVAKGRPPEAGVDGRLELLVDPEPEVPEPGPGGSIDFKSFSFFRSVKQGDRLARLLPGSPGKPGFDVFGREIPAPQPRDFSQELGRNTAFLDRARTIVVAAAPGRLAMRMDIPEVVEELAVEGDVSLKTGHIEFPGAVRVSGDVHSRMEIEAKGDVEVDGTVEDSVIRTDGAIVVKGGVNGQGNGLIKSRLSSVTIGYLHNQCIESATNIVVFNEIIGSRLRARKAIGMRFGRYTVLGGHLLAGESLDLFNVGAEAGVKTVLEVGKDFEVEAELIRWEKRIQEDTRDMEFLRDMEEKLEHVLRLTRGGADEETLLLARTQGALEILERRIAEARKEAAVLSTRLYLPGPCEVRIRGIAHPGTVIRYRDQLLLISSPVTNRRWVFRDKSPLPSSEGQPGGA